MKIYNILINMQVQQLLLICSTLFSFCIALLIYVYKIQIQRIQKLENIQRQCPVNKIYTILETVKRDVNWIKDILNKD